NWTRLYVWVTKTNCLPLFRINLAKINLMSTEFAYEKKETILQLKNVSLSYGTTQVLKDVNAQILNIHRSDTKQGQVVSLLAASGIVKSCLLRIIAGLENPTSGEVLVDFPPHSVKVGTVGVI